MSRTISRGILLMVGSSALFSVMAALGKVGVAHVPAAEGVFFRSLVGLCILLPLHLATGRPLSTLLGRNRRLLALRGLFGSIALLTFFHMLRELSLAETTVLIQSSTLFVVLFAALFLGERLRGLQYLCIGLALVGVLLVVQPGWSGFRPAAAWGVLGAATSGAAYVTIRSLTATEGNTTILAWFLGISLLVSVPLSALDHARPTSLETLALIGSGAASMFAQLLMNQAYRLEQAGPVSATATLGVVFSALVGLACWGEIPTPVKAIGSGVIVLALVGLALRPALPGGTTAPG